MLFNLLCVLNNFCAIRPLGFLMCVLCYQPIWLRFLLIPQDFFGFYLISVQEVPLSSLAVSIPECIGIQDEFS